MRQNPDRAKKSFVATCSMTNVTGHGAPPTAGTTLIGRVTATMTRITASARMAVPQMTVQIRCAGDARGGPVPALTPAPEVVPSGDRSCLPPT
jgi:hypothetical protein